jgi:hypothetical protein
MRETKDFEPLFNESCDHLLESGIIQRLHKERDHEDSSYYGVVSHKFYKKVGRTSGSIIEQVYNYPTAPDVFSFFPKNPKLNLINQGNGWHPHFKEIYKRIAQLMHWDLQIDHPRHKMEGIYSNHWIAKEEVFDKFVREYLNPVVKFMEKDRKLKKLCFLDANYISRDKIDPETCKLVFGKPYYTYHCFILERLFPVFCYLEKLDVKHL